MFETIGGIVFILAFIAVFTVPIGMFNVKMYKGSIGESPSALEVLKAYTPFANVRYARVLAYGSSPLYFAGLLACAVVIVVRIIAIILMAVGVGLGVYIAFFSAFASIAAVVLWWALAAINGVDFANMLQAGFVTKVACIILPPLGYYMLSNVVLPYFRSEEVGANDTFGASN